MNRSAVAALSLLLLAAGSAAADTPRTKTSRRVETYRFTADVGGKQSLDSGVSLIRNSELLLYRGYNVAADAAGIHDHWYTRPLSLPVIMMLLPSPSEFLHEYYGHGAVLREGGFDDVRYRWSWFRSGSGEGLAESMKIQTTGTYEEKQLWVMGGLASSQLYLLEAEKEMYRQGKMTLLFLQAVIGAENDLGYVSDGLDPLSSNSMNDGGTWLRFFKDRYGTNPGPVATAADRSKDAIDRASLMNPALYWTAVTWLHYFWTGSDSYYAPMVPVAGLNFGFSPKVNITPLGAENYYYLFVSRRGVLASAYRRSGESLEGNFNGYGLEVGPIKILGLSLTPGYDRWTQPDPQDAQLKYSGSGYNTQLKLDFPIYGALGFTGKAGYKTRGYLLGLPSDAGSHGYAGLSLTF